MPYQNNNHKSDSDIIHELKQKVKIAELQNQLNKLTHEAKENEMLTMLKEIKAMLRDHREIAVIEITDALKKTLKNATLENVIDDK